MRVAIVVLGVLLCSTAAAEPQAWMIKENPDTLHFYVSADTDCPFSTDELTELVNGVLVRSRLRPGNFHESAETLGFKVIVSCLEKEPGGQFFIYDVDIGFVRFLFGRNLTEGWPRYGGIGQGRGASIIRQVQNSVEEIVTDYLQANFDLTPE